MLKLFPKSRICAIDILPSIEIGLQKATSFLEKHNISIYKTDGKNILLSFCIKEIEFKYKNTSSIYPKVIYISTEFKNQKIRSFVVTLLEGVLQKINLPYCGKFAIDSPDLEFAAELCLSKTRKTKSFNKLKARLKIKTA